MPLPLFLYNMPSQVKVMIEVKTVAALSHHPNIAGLKDSSGNIGYFNACRYAVKDRRDFSVLMGPEEAMGEAVLMGAAGGVAGGANLFPRLFVDLSYAPAPPTGRSTDFNTPVGGFPRHRSASTRRISRWF